MNLPGTRLYLLCLDLEREHGVGVLKYIVWWGGLRGYPVHLPSWSFRQCRNATEEIARRIQSVYPQTPLTTE